MTRTSVRYLGAIMAVVFVILLMVGCAGRSSNKATATESKAVEYIVVETENGYGYKIFLDGKLYINQPNIPGLPGTAGFDDEASARRIAELAVSKIKQGIMLPTISLEELEANGIKTGIKSMNE